MNTADELHCTDETLRRNLPLSSGSAFISLLYMEVSGFSEMMVTAYQTARHHISGDHNYAFMSCCPFSQYCILKTVTAWNIAVVEACELNFRHLVGAFAKLRKAIFSFAKPLHPSLPLAVRVEQLGCHWTEFYKILYLNIFWKYFEKISSFIKVWQK